MGSSIAKEKEIEHVDVPLLIRKKFGIDLDKSFAGRTNEYMMVIDKTENLLYVSDCALSWLGITLEAVKGSNYRKFKTRYLQDRHSVLLDTLETGVNYEGVLEKVNLGKHIAYVECSTMLLVDESGARVGALLWARDITSRIHGAKQMQQYETMKTINNFATSMSHHLKNPLTAVIGFVQLLKNQTSLENNEQYCAWALEELQRIGDVLERISHLGASAEGQQLITLPDLLQGIQRSLQTTATTMRIRVQMDTNPPAVILKGHYEQLREAILCLAHNGMEAMPAGGHLSVQAYYHRKLAMVEIRVIDQGTGGYNIESIFQPFYSSSVDRTGLGLNIAEHVAMVHRGYVKLQPNESGFGTTASLFLPAAVNISCDAAGIHVN